MLKKKSDKHWENSGKKGKKRAKEEYQGKLTGDTGNERQQI